MGRFFLTLVALAALLVAAPTMAQVPGMFQPLLTATQDLPASITLTDHKVNSSASSTQTFSAVSLGSAFAGRHIIFSCGSAIGAGSLSITSATLAGNAATQIVQTSGTAGGVTTAVALFIISDASNTSATVVCNYGASVGGAGVGAWSIANLQSATATATGTSAANPMTANINVLAGGIAVGYAATYQSASAPTFTWSGITEGFDETVFGTTAQTGAALAFSAAQSPLTVTATPSASTTPAMVTASFR